MLNRRREGAGRLLLRALRDITKCSNQYLIESWCEKKALKDFEGNSGNLNMGWVLDNSELVFILLGIIMILWLCKKMFFLGDAC